MIANFFQSLEDHAVEYLLISGQATVLYGAATFSEDVDLWINPTRRNLPRFAVALRACGAAYYKLTPPMSLRHLARGHGFHFTLPASSGPPVYLDVMGVPPRVGRYADALPDARWLGTQWGRIHLIGLKALVELKKTQRLEDYPVISRLALAWFEQPGVAGSPADFRWARDNLFTLGEMKRFILEHPAALESISDRPGVRLREYGRQLLAGGEGSQKVEEGIVAWMHRRAAKLQLADRRHWRGVIRELKALRAGGGLATEGSPI